MRGCFRDAGKCFLARREGKLGWSGGEGERRGNRRQSEYFTTYRYKILRNLCWTLDARKYHINFSSVVVIKSCRDLDQFSSGIFGVSGCVQSFNAPNGNKCSSRRCHGPNCGKCTSRRCHAPNFDKSSSRGCHAHNGDKCSRHHTTPKSPNSDRCSCSARRCDAPNKMPCSERRGSLL